MKKQIIFIVTAVFLSIFFLSFTFANLKNPIKNLQTQEDTIKTNPHVDIKVNKEYDEDGNIIRYDSSYTYIYHNSDGNFEELNVDSIFHNFKPYFFDHGFEIMQSPFKEFFKNDTIYQHHFFDEDYFLQHFNKQLFEFENMMKEMDSLRNLYLKDLYPEYQYQQKNKQNPSFIKNKKEI